MFKTLFPSYKIRLLLLLVSPGLVYGTSRLCCVYRHRLRPHEMFAPCCQAVTNAAGFPLPFDAKVLGHVLLVLKVVVIGVRTSKSHARRGVGKEQEVGLGIFRVYGKVLQTEDHQL